FSIDSVISNSEITPSRRGRMATISDGVRPTISRASAPIARGRRVRLLIATHDGSLITIPRSRILTSVLAVPRSIPMSSEKRPSNQSSGRNNAFTYDVRSLLASRRVPTKRPCTYLFDLYPSPTSPHRPVATQRSDQL